MTTATQDRVDSTEELQYRKSDFARSLERARRQVGELDRQIERLRELGRIKVHQGTFTVVSRTV